MLSALLDWSNHHCRFSVYFFASNSIVYSINNAIAVLKFHPGVPTPSSKAIQRNALSRGSTKHGGPTSSASANDPSNTSKAIPQIIGHQQLPFLAIVLHQLRYRTTYLSPVSLRKETSRILPLALIPKQQRIPGSLSADQASVNYGTIKVSPDSTSQPGHRTNLQMFQGQYDRLSNQRSRILSLRKSPETARNNPEQPRRASINQKTDEAPSSTHQSARGRGTGSSNRGVRIGKR